MTDDPQIAALESKFHEQLGRAIAKWQHVEISLCRILHSVAPHDDCYFTAETFYAAINFRDKLSMVNVAVQYRLAQHHDLLATWNTLRGKCSKAAMRRNAIAHGIVWREWKAGRIDPSYKIGPHPWWALGPTDREDQSRHIYVSQVEDAIARFTRVHDGLLALWNEIDARLKPPPKPHAPSLEK